MLGKYTRSWTACSGAQHGEGITFDGFKAHCPLADLREELIAMSG